MCVLLSPLPWLLLSPQSHLPLCALIPYLTSTERIEREGRALGTPTRKDRKTVLALTAKERTAAAEQTTRSDRRTSFWKEKAGCEVCSVWLPQQPSAGESAAGHQPATCCSSLCQTSQTRTPEAPQRRHSLAGSLASPVDIPGRVRPVWCW